jgi:hypothetical protein
LKEAWLANFSFLGSCFSAIPDSRLGGWPA